MLGSTRQVKRHVIAVSGNCSRPFASFDSREIRSWHFTLLFG
jgi:hypothetical protein